MSKTKIIKIQYFFLVLLAFSSISTTYSNNLTNNLATHDSLTSATTDKLKIIGDEVIRFLNASQDLSSEELKIMDQAYYLGNIYHLLSKKIIINDTTIVNGIFNFVQSARNLNGGYANWPNGSSSLESTYQAMKLYILFNRTSDLLPSELTVTLDYINSLQTPAGGYFPLADWDVPDVTSTYRAIELLSYYHSPVNQSAVIGYLSQNYVIPLFLNQPSGYSEISGGKADLLATYYTLKTYELLNVTNDKVDQVAGFLNSLYHINGGVSKLPESSPTVGYTAIGLKLFSLLNSSYSITMFNSTMFDSSIQYLLSTKQPGTGFSSSTRDTSPGISSTFFALDVLSILENKQGVTLLNFPYEDIQTFIHTGQQPTTGTVNYPVDISDLSYTVRALLIGKLLGNTSWFRGTSYIHATYDETINGFAFRPNAAPTVKYTYYGIRGLRALGDPLETVDALKNYLMSAQNPDGLFGKKPVYHNSYITYTYWALQALYYLNAIHEINPEPILQQLRFYKNIDGSYSNYPGNEASLISTYRAFRIRQLLGNPIPLDERFKTSLFLYRTSSGGYVDRLSRTVPSMEATYFGLKLAELLNIQIDTTQAMQFVLSLQNKDGGFAIRPKFSSRISSTFYAVSLFYEQAKGQISANEDVADIFAPMIYPSFNSRIDTNVTIFGSYTTTATIADPEGFIADSWVELIFTDLAGNTYYSTVSGEFIDVYWYYSFGPFTNGYLTFRIVASDEANNTAITSWFQLLTFTATITSSPTSLSLMTTLITYIPIIILLISLIDVIYRKFQNKSGEIQMHILENTPSYFSEVNIVYLSAILIGIAGIANLLLGDAILVLQQSVFLFQFLFALLTILFLRYVVGMQSYGYFGPSVIALSWLKIGPFWGFILFVNIFVLAVVVRSLLQPYNLPVGFRIGIVMLFLITALSVLEVIGEIYLIPFLSGSILIPILITPWISDRYVQDILQTDQLDAFLRFTSTMLITLLAFMSMYNTQFIVYLILHPALWVAFGAIIYYFGRTRHYTYFDKKRFDRIFHKKHKPLTMISRNRDIIAKYNQQMLYPFINKFYLKEQFDKWRVPTAALLAVINDEQDVDVLLQRFLTESTFASGFVIKPSESFGGKGIVVIQQRIGNYFIISGQKYHVSALREHIIKILQGEYLTSQTNAISDVVIIEEKIVVDPDLAKISYGLPDIRVIVFNGAPIMAMARLPTKESDGKANLKQGAIGAAIDMETGQIIRAEYKKHPINVHPDTGYPISDFMFNNWREILAVASLAQKSTGLGYAGVDLVIDDNGRILVLEVNKRPGLEIQNINLATLLSRIEYVELHHLNLIDKSPQQCATLAIDLGKIWSEKNE